MPYKDLEKQKQATHESYLRHKPRLRQDSLLRKAEHRNIISKLKESTPCADCQQFFPACVMDFDHINGKKKSGIAQMYGYSWEIIQTELNKCELVCANCHRIRTHKLRCI